MNLKIIISFLFRRTLPIIGSVTTKVMVVTCSLELADSKGKVVNHKITADRNSESISKFLLEQLRCLEFWHG